MRLRHLVGKLIRKGNPLDIEQIKIPIKNTSSTSTSLKIAHLSDVHIPRCAFSPCEIAEAVAKEKPDMIFLTGDVMDGYLEFDGPRLSLLISLLLEIAPIYAISGNHERKNKKYHEIWKTMLELRGVHLIDDQVKYIEKDGIIFVIIGMRDVSIKKGLIRDVSFLEEMEVIDEACYLLLHHKPNVWRIYYPLDIKIPTIVFSGHAHGGQVRIPFIKRGLLAPDQGIFPKYTSGLYKYSDGSNEIVSRGLASATKPIRVNNKPHIPIVELVPEG